MYLLLLLLSVTGFFVVVVTAVFVYWCNGVAVVVEL